MKYRFASHFAVLVLGAVWTSAADPFVATARTTDTPTPLVLTAQGSNFFDFLSSLVNTQGSFQSLNNRPYTGSMTFLGVQDAVRFTTNAAGTVINITLAPTGFNRTFTGPSKQAVDDLLEDFFRKDGASTIADFLKEVAKTSPIAVTDGNPTSATAMAASGTFTGQGFTSSAELSDGLEASDTASVSGKSKLGGISFGLNTGRFEAGAFEGKNYDFAGTILNFGGETVRFIVPVSANFLELDSGSQVGGAGISLCLPIRFKKMSKENPLNWRVTPLVGFSVRGSVDLASLSPLWSAGAVNTLDYRLSPKWVLSMVNQFTTHKSLALSYDDLDFDPAINQQIVKNGLRLSTPVAPRLILDGFVIDTRFLKEAAVDQFWTFGGSLALRATRSWNLVLGANYDTGDNFKAYSLGISSAWKW